MFFNIFNKDKKTADSKEKTEENQKKEDSFIGRKTDDSISGIEFLHRFTEQYAPYTLKDYVIKERSYDEIPEIDESRPQLRSMARQVDLKRSEDPVVGSKIAAQEIYINIKNMLKDDRGVHAETLLAVLASVGGRLCVQGIMNTLDSMVSYDVPDRKKLLYTIAALLQILIVETKNDDIYIMGDRLGNEFMIFYNNTIAEMGDAQKLVPIAKKTAETIGTEDYWKTPFDELVKQSPQKLADIFTGAFEVTFKTYCRFPQERMLAVAFAAQTAVNELVKNNVMEKDKAASIISEYGWRTAHFWKGSEH